MRERVADALSSLDLPRAEARAARGALASGRRFADGSAWRVEIPSVEGPEAMRAVMAESAKRTVPVHRVSQGSGTALLTDAELGEMADLGRRQRVRGGALGRSAGRLGHLGHGELPVAPPARPRTGFAAPLRYHEIEEIVEVAAPVHLKFGLRNVAGVYPAGGHIAATVVSASREQVQARRYRPGDLRRRAPELYGRKAAGPPGAMSRKRRAKGARRRKACRPSPVIEAS